MRDKKTILLLSFISGFSVMVVELTAARIIAPMLGSSVYTWTSVIGIVLLGSSLGNFLGGKIIDKISHSCTKGVLFWLSSASILFVPALAGFIRGVALMQIPLYLSVLMAAGLLFLLPSMFLGALYPAMFKLYLQNASSVGKETGAVSASWTLGSIFGTFLTGFVFVGYFGSTNTLIMISLVLFSCSFWLLPRNKSLVIFSVSYIIAFLILFFGQNGENDKSQLIFKGESNYYSVRVVDKKDDLFGKIRILFLDADSHSIEDETESLRDSYTNFFPTFSIFEGLKADNILVIGGGSLEISEKFKEYYPQAKVTTLEIDPLVTKTAEKYFNTSSYVIENTFPEDGRLFLSRSEDKFDVIFSDAYNSFISVPWHLTTREFFQIAKSRLNSDGAFAINFISAQEGPESGLYQSILATFSAVFDNYYVFCYGGKPMESQNIILVGMNSQKRLSNGEVEEKLAKLPGGKELKRHFKGDVKKKKEAIILTDDFAPTDRLMMPTINSYFPKYILFLNSAL